MLRIRKQHLAITCAALATSWIGLGVSVAHAEYLTWGVKMQPQIFGSSPEIVTLNQAPDGILTVNVLKNTTVMINFSAECSVSETDFTSYADINIEVQKPGTPYITVPPTNDDDAFCSSNGTSADDGRITTSRTVADTLLPGRNSIRVRAKTVGIGKTRLDDLSLLVSK